MVSDGFDIDDFVTTTTYYDEVLGKCSFRVSPECKQDIGIYMKMLFAIRTGPFTDEEVEGWQMMMKKLDEMDWEGAYRRVKIQRKPCGDLQWTT